ncbi:hypothetical protein [Rhodococcus koreensis]|uniref:hypothetical protein n=1 Tax=Rhodococcus koreensis TaxID=99653 RepID=UPI00197E3F7A|nr:hypothetical protein [Rhodococcus koreensis]QSE87068.1 hypothetical protein JWS14_49205 [Rhodococcus koreensis]
MTTTEADYRQTCTVEAERGLLELANHIARKRQTTPTDVTLPTTKGWLIAARITSHGNDEKEEWTYEDQAVLGQDGRLYQGRYEQEFVKGENFGNVFTNYRTWGTQCNHADYAPMESTHYEEWDVCYSRVDHPNGKSWRISRLLEYEHPHTLALKKALEEFDNKDHAALIEQQDKREKADIKQRQLGDARKRTEIDWIAIGLAALAAVTVLGPYLIGHFLMRRTPLLEEYQAIFDPEVRGIWDHFGPDYLAGLVVIAALLALFLLVRPWKFRTISIVIGWVVVAVTLFFLLPMTTSTWDAAEGKSLANLRETAFPFAERYYDCASWTFASENGAQQPELWQVHLGQLKGASVDGCNKVDVYRGWRFVGTFVLDGGDTFTSEITVTSPDWSEPYDQDTGSGEIYSVSGTTGEHAAFNPVTTSIQLPTEFGRVLQFTLDGAGRDGFTI